MTNPMSYQNSKSEPLVKQGLYPVMSSGLLSSPLSQTIIQPINFGYDETKEHCLSDDEYYLEKLRKENLLKTVKNMKEEQIFLFEVFVDAIHILKENELLEPLQQYGPLPPLRVRIQFGTVPCFDIHEEEILITQNNLNDEDMLTGKVIRLGQENQGWQQHVDHGEWKSAYGKSCLFFMKPLEVMRSIQSSPITVNVYRTVNEDYEHPTSSIGHTRIRLEEHFIDCILQTADVNTEFPVSSFQTNEYHIHNLKGDDTGSMRLFFRLSCYGDKISTKFQSINHDQEYIFKLVPGKQLLEDVLCEPPEEYAPLPFLGKNDIIPLPPMISSDEHLLGVCKSISKITPENHVPKSMIKDFNAQEITKKIVCDCSSNKCCESYNKNNSFEMETYMTKMNSSEFDDNLSTRNFKQQNPNKCKCKCNKCKCKCNNCKEFLEALQRLDNCCKKCVRDEDRLVKCCSECVWDKLRIIQEYDGKLSDNFDLCNLRDGVEDFDNDNFNRIDDSTRNKYCTKSEPIIKLMSNSSNRRSSVNITSISTKVEYKDTTIQDSKKNSKIDFLEKGDYVDNISSITNNISIKDTNYKRKMKGKRGLKKITVNCASKINNRFAVKTNKKKIFTQFDYSERGYPGLNIGHKHCVDDDIMVPKNMGWLWNIENKCLGIKLRRGWTPGAIGKSVTGRIMHIKKAQDLTKKTLILGGFKSPEDDNIPIDTKSGDTYLLNQPPTFHLKQTGGMYCLAMNPIKNEDDSESQKPVEFQVMPEERDSSSKSYATSKTSLDIVFTCPGALRRKVVKPICKHINTQYEEADLVVKSVTQEKKKGKSKKEMIKPLANQEPELNTNLWEDQQTQMSLQTNKAKK